MLNWVQRNKNLIIRTMFIIPIILVAVISISHVVSWYDLSNPISWAIYLSIAVEIAAMTALSAASVRVKGFSVWLVFGIVTFIQFMGNIFFSYKEIDINDGNFKSWVELVSPVYDMMGIDSSDILSHKRWLSLLTGGLLPLISLTCLHFFIKYGGADEETKNLTEDTTTKDINTNTGNGDEEKINQVQQRIEKLKEELVTKETNETEEENTNPETTINPENVDEGEEKKNSSTESTDDGNQPESGGGSIDTGETNNTKIQMGSSRSGENIVYKDRGLRR